MDVFCHTFKEMQQGRSFCPKTAVGNILDDLTFAINFVKNDRKGNDECRKRKY